MTYSVDGLDDFLKKLRGLTLDRTLNKSIAKSMILLERNAKIETPVDTGLLRNSYETDLSQNLIGRLRNTRKYGLYVHEGTKYQKANPFMQRGLDKSRSRIEDIFINDLEDLLLTLQ